MAISPFLAGTSTRQLKTHCAIDAASKKILGLAIDKLGLSARAHDHILETARTLADLAGEDALAPTHIAEAIPYPSLDREDWS